MALAKPKYLQVEDYIRGLIANETLVRGDQIPTEEELCERFGFSRMTVNKALTRLVSDGYIARIPGRGSFVTARHMDKSLNLSESFSQHMVHMGTEAGARLLSYEVVEAGAFPEAMNKLQLEEHDLVHHFLRLRTGDGTPIAINDTFIPTSVVPAINIDCLNGSLYDYLSSIGLPAGHMDMTISALLPNDMQREMLHAEDAAILCSSHVTMTEKDGCEVFLEYTSTYYNGDMYTYRYQA